MDVENDNFDWFDCGEGVSGAVEAVGTQSTQYDSLRKWGK